MHEDLLVSSHIGLIVNYIWSTGRFTIIKWIKWSVFCPFFMSGRLNIVHKYQDTRNLFSVRTREHYTFKLAFRYICNSELPFFILATSWLGLYWPLSPFIIHSDTCFSNILLTTCSYFSVLSIILFLIIIIFLSIPFFVCVYIVK